MNLFSNYTFPIYFIRDLVVYLDQRDFEETVEHKVFQVKQEHLGDQDHKARLGLLETLVLLDHQAKVELR